MIRASRSVTDGCSWMRLEVGWSGFKVKFTMALICIHCLKLSIQWSMCERSHGNTDQSIVCLALAKYSLLDLTLKMKESGPGWVYITNTHNRVNVHQWRNSGGYKERKETNASNLCKHADWQNLTVVTNDWECVGTPCTPSNWVRVAMASVSALCGSIFASVIPTRPWREGIPCSAVPVSQGNEPWQRPAEMWGGLSQGNRTGRRTLLFFAAF